MTDKLEKDIRDGLNAFGINESNYKNHMPEIAVVLANAASSNNIQIKKYGDLSSKLNNLNVYLDAKEDGKNTFKKDTCLIGPLSKIFTDKNTLDAIQDELVCKIFGSNDYDNNFNIIKKQDEESLGKSYVFDFRRAYIGIDKFKLSAARYIAVKECFLSIDDNLKSIDSEFKNLKERDRLYIISNLLVILKDDKNLGNITLDSDIVEKRKGYIEDLQNTLNNSYHFLTNKSLDSRLIAEYFVDIAISQKLESVKTEPNFSEKNHNAILALLNNSPFKTQQSPDWLFNPDQLNELVKIRVENICKGNYSSNARPSAIAIEEIELCTDESDEVSNQKTTAENTNANNTRTGTGEGTGPSDAATDESAGRSEGGDDDEDEQEQEQEHGHDHDHEASTPNVTIATISPEVLKGLTEKYLKNLFADRPTDLVHTSGNQPAEAQETRTAPSYTPTVPQTNTPAATPT